MGQHGRQRRDVLISGVILLPFAHPWSGSPSFDAFGLLLMAYTVVIGTFGSFSLYLAGVMRIGAMRATMLGTSEPVAATVSSVVFLGAVFTPTDLVGFVMILVMVLSFRRCDVTCVTSLTLMEAAAATQARRHRT